MFISSYFEAASLLRNIFADWDQASGDGDFGDNLTDGLRLVVAAIPPHTSLGDEFNIAGATFMDQVGGTSGPLIGLLFAAVAHEFNSSDGSESDHVWRGLNAGLAAIKRVGEAQVGDRTMVDVLEPVLTEQADAGTPVDWTRAASSAWIAAEHTAAFTARRGRASYVGNRALGVPDPGAMAMALLFWTLATLLAPVGEPLIDTPGLMRQLHTSRRS